MDERQILCQCLLFIVEAERALNNGKHDDYCRAMSNLLDFLITELVGVASNETQTKIDNL